MIFAIYNCKIVHLFIVITIVDILLSMRKYMSRSKQIIYLCNLTMSVQVIKFLCEMFSDCNMSTIVMTINKCMHLVMFYYFAVINCKYHNLLKSYIYLKLTAF